MTLLLRDGTLPALQPAIRIQELSDAVRHHATSLDCLRAPLITVRRPHTYVTLADMRLIHARIQTQRALRPSAPAPMAVDSATSSGHTQDAAASGGPPRMSPQAVLAEPPTRNDRLRQIPRITFERWSLLL